MSDPIKLYFAMVLVHDPESVLNDNKIVLIFSNSIFWSFELTFAWTARPSSHLFGGRVHVIMYHCGISTSLWST